MPGPRSACPGRSARSRSSSEAAARPHHAYVLAGPEGGGKRIAARAFAAALLCRRGGCGECRDCRLALADQHPNVSLVEPEGRDIHVDTVRDGGLAARVPDRARARPQGVRDPRGRPAEPRRRRHAAQGARGAARRLGDPAAVGAARRAARDRALALPRGDVPPAVRAVRRRGARRRGRRARRGRHRGAAVRREPRPRAPAGHRRRGDWRSATTAREALALAGIGSGGRARGRRRVLAAADALQEGARGIARRTSSRRSSTSAAARRTRTAPRSAGSRSGTIARSAAPSATTSTGCCSPSSALLRDRVVAAIGGGTDLLLNPDVPAATGDLRAVPRRRAALAACEEARAALADDVEPQHAARARAGVPAARAGCGVGRAPVRRSGRRTEVVLASLSFLGPMGR